MELPEILKLMEKKYPSGPRRKAGWLGAMLILYDDGGGYIRRTAKGREIDDRDYMHNQLFCFSTLDELIKHLQEK